MTNITRITNEQEAIEAGAILPCPAIGYIDGPTGGPGLDKISLRAASDLMMSDLHQHHKPGTGELLIPRGYREPARIRPVAQTHANSVFGDL